MKFWFTTLIAIFMHAAIAKAPIIKHPTTPETWDEPSHPIPSLSVLDVYAIKKTGGADLVIVVASPMEADEHSLDRLDKKIRGYVNFMNSADFAKEAGVHTAQNTNIVVRLHPLTVEAVWTRLQSYKSWIFKNGATLLVLDLDQKI